MTKLPIAEREAHGYTFSASLVQSAHIHGWSCEEFDAVAETMRSIDAPYSVAGELIEQALLQPWTAKTLIGVLIKAGLRRTLGQFDQWKADTERWANSPRGAETRRRKWALPEGRFRGSKHGLLGAFGWRMLGWLHALNGGVLAKPMPVSLKTDVPGIGKAGDTATLELPSADARQVKHNAKVYYRGEHVGTGTVTE